MKTWGARRGRVGARPLAALTAAWLLLGSGCAALRPGQQFFNRIETHHFEISSSFGPEATRRLARDLELFHAGCLSLFGLDETPPGHHRSRVLAFDDRALGRPFGQGAEASYLVPGIDQATIVFRVPGDWNERASPALRVDYARLLLRSVSTRRLPLWLEAGLAEVASAIQLRGDEIRLGAVVEAHAASVEDWRQSSFAPLLRRSHLVGASASEVTIFEAQAWATAHALVFPVTGDPVGDGAGSETGLLREMLGAWRAGATEPFGADAAPHGVDGESLAVRVYEHLARRRYPMRVLRPFGWELEKLELSPIEIPEVELLLGELALALGRDAPAERAFERSLREQPGQSRALAGLARVVAAEDFDRAESVARRALAGGTDDAEVQRSVGVLYARSVEKATAESERLRRAQAAQAHLRASLTLDSTSAADRVEMARVAIVLGQWEEAARWLEAAARLRPAALAVDAMLARLQFQQGRSTAARLQARDVYSRTRWAPLRAEVGRYLNEPGA